MACTDERGVMAHFPMDHGGHDEFGTRRPPRHLVVHPDILGESGDLGQTHAVGGGFGIDQGGVVRIGKFLLGANPVQGQRAAAEGNLRRMFHGPQAIFCAAHPFRIRSGHVQPLELRQQFI